MKKNMLFALFSIILVITLLLFIIQSGGRVENIETETFISKWMTNDNGTLATFLKGDSTQDTDQVQGREALSESLGLWMQYALEKDDQDLFEESYLQLQQWFLEDSGFIYWRLSPIGEAEVTTNALVDDFRIYKVLQLACNRWGDEKYGHTAEIIGEFLIEHLVSNSYFADYYDNKSDYLSPVLTLSYVDIEALFLLREEVGLEHTTFNRMLELLNTMPTKNGFYPMSYHVSENRFEFTKEINLIDQLLVSLHSQSHKDELIPFIKKELDHRQAIYGRYNLETKEPTVSYESPAVYSLVIMKAIELEDKELAKQAYMRMIRFRSSSSKYKGAYSLTNQNTHVFDNLMPLLAIEKMKTNGWIEK
ncbi:glycosyl hydrolase [Halobacillus locisalis]|uniref:Glycosyl hydrolase n=1 Tax=Halobacillus locisalis TaxID=220753 RepID=A0A838CU55_9BACI|nr:glycosyl hydrolase [Halobacillus locisalis]MBA2175451.1 glycosyl hydrolase [Halobacillus locisalis]